MRESRETGRDTDHSHEEPVKYVWLADSVSEATGYPLKKMLEDIDSEDLLVQRSPVNPSQDKTGHLEDDPVEKSLKERARLIGNSIGRLAQTAIIEIRTAIQEGKRQ